MVQGNFIQVTPFMHVDDVDEAVRFFTDLLDFEAPPDAWPVVRQGQKYVVHDHIEMAETASGGHYPAGMISALLFE